MGSPLDWLNQHIAQPAENALGNAGNAAKNYVLGGIHNIPNAINTAGDASNRILNTVIGNPLQTAGRAALNTLFAPTVAGTGDEVNGKLPQIPSNTRAYNQQAIQNFNLNGRTDALSRAGNFAGQAAPFFVPGAQGLAVGSQLGSQLGNNASNNQLFSKDSLQDVGQAGVNLIPSLPTGRLTQTLSPALRWGANAAIAGTENVVRGQGSSLIETGRPDTDINSNLNQFATGAALHSAFHPVETATGVADTVGKTAHAVRNAQDFGALRDATHTFNAPLPTVDVPHEVNGIPVKINGEQTVTQMTHPNIETKEVPFSMAEDIIRRRQDPRDPIVSGLGAKDAGTVPISFDKTNGSIVSWGDDNTPVSLINKIHQSALGGAAMRPNGYVGNGENVPRAEDSVKDISQDPQAAALAANHSNVPLTTELPSNTGTGSNVKERQFITRGKVSPDVSPEAQSQLEGEYTQKANKELVANAQQRITTNPTQAHDFALSNNNDEATATAIELARHYNTTGQHDLEAQVINEKAKQLTEAGRTIQAAKLMKTLSPEGQASLAARSIQQYNETAGGLFGNKKVPELTGEQVKDITTKAKAIEQLPEGDAKGLAQQKLWEHIADLTPSSWSDRVLGLRRAGLLTSPATYAKVVASHAAFSAGERASNFLAGKVIDPAISLFSKQRGTTGTLQDYGSGLVQGGKESANRLVTGYDPNATFDSIKNRRTTYGNGVVGKAAQGYVDAVGRSHTVLPGAFHEAALQNSLRDQGLTEAINKGLKGADRQAYADQFVKNPPQSAIDAAHKDADYETFNNRTALGDAISKVQQVPGIGPVAKFLVPFTRVPSAITAAVTDYSPVGAAKGIWDAVHSPEGFTPSVQRDLSKEIGRSIVGTAAIAFGAALAQKGLVHTKPKDAKEADLWKAQGIQNNSITINGVNHTLGSFGPAGTDLAVGAYFANGLKDTKKTPGSVLGAAAQGAEGLAATQLDQPYLQGAATITDAIKNPTTRGQSALNAAAGSFVPSFSSDLANATDTSKRIQTGAMDAVKYRIPGARETLPQSVDVLGNPISNGSNSVIGKVFDPTATTNLATDSVTKELGRLHDANLDATPSAVGKTITAFGVSQDLTPQQTSDYQKIVGSHINQGISDLIKTPEYQGLDDSAKQAAIQKLDTLIRQRDSINYSATNNLPQTDLTPGNNSDRQAKQDLKVQAANAYQDGNGAQYYKLLSQLPHAQQVTVANEIKQAFGDQVSGKPLSPTEQVVNSLKPAASTVLGTQVGAANNLNNINGFINRQQFELKGPDPQPIYQLPIAKLGQNSDPSQPSVQAVLAVKALLPGEKSDYTDAIKSQPWYKQYVQASQAWYTRNPSSPDYVNPAGPSPEMSPELQAYANQIAAVKAAGGSTAAYYKTPQGQQLSQYYNSLDQYQNTKLGLVGLPAAYVPSTQYPGELAAVGSAAGGGSGGSSSSVSSAHRNARKVLASMSKPKGGGHGKIRAPKAKLAKSTSHGRITLPKTTPGTFSGIGKVRKPATRSA